VQPAVVLERKGIGESFGRSSELVRGSWWRVFGIGLLVFVLFAIAGGVLTTVLSVAVSERVSVVVSALVNVLVEPFALGSLVLLYYDLRLRKEGTIGEPVGAVSSSPSF
jgi:hypothetical protein